MFVTSRYQARPIDKFLESSMTKKEAIEIIKKILVEESITSDEVPEWLTGDAKRLFKRLQKANLLKSVKD